MYIEKIKVCFKIIIYLKFKYINKKLNKMINGINKKP